MSDPFFLTEAPDTALAGAGAGSPDFPPKNEPAASDASEGSAPNAAGKMEVPKTGSTGRARSRIAQAGEKLLDLAKRSPSLLEKPAPRLTMRKDLPPPAFGLEARLSESEREQLVEVMDGEDRPLVCMPPEAALRQKLPVRMVAVALRTRRKRMILRKRRDARLGFPGRWDLYTGFVMVGEAREDAALRLLSSDTGLSGLRVFPLPGHGGRGEWSPLFTLFVADLPTGLYPGHPVQEMMTVDADELAGLIRDVPELFSPELARAAAEWDLPLT